MTLSSPTLERRAFVRAVGAAAVGASVAGCLGAGDDGNEHVVLPEPDAYDRTKDADVAWPIYGDPLPEATVPAPLHGRTVETTEFLGERHTLFTFIFTRCPGVCPGLTATLRHVQEDSIDRGYADEVALMPITFDPEYDTPDVLEAYADEHGVDREAGNWYFLRPESHADAKDVVEETFGCGFERMEVDDDEDAHADHGGHDGDDGEDGHGVDEDDEPETDFMHATLVIFANADGYVERAYAGDVPTPGTVLDDVGTVVEGW